MDIAFYHLTTSSLEKTLPKLLEKVYQSGVHSVVLIDSVERLKILNGVLWTYSTGAFLPHGSIDEPADTHALQPIWLTTLASENPNNATVLVVTSSQEIADFGGYTRCLDVFDGNDTSSLDAARLRFKAYQDKGHIIVYWRQNLTGAWEKVENFS